MCIQSLGASREGPRYGGAESPVSSTTLNECHCAARDCTTWHAVGSTQMDGCETRTTDIAKWHFAFEAIVLRFVRMVGQTTFYLSVLIALFLFLEFRNHACPLPPNYFAVFLVLYAFVIPGILTTGALIEEAMAEAATPYSVVASNGIDDDDEKMNGDSLVFGTVDPDTVPKDETVAPPPPSQEINGEEEARIPVEEKSSPFEEDARTPAEQQSAPSEEEKEEEEARIPVDEKSSPFEEDPRDEQSSPSEEEEDSRTPVEEQGAPAKEEARIPVDEKSSPFEEDAHTPVEEQGASAEEEPRIPVDEKSSPFAQEPPNPMEESEAEVSDPSEAWTTSELGRVATRIIPHLLNLYNSTSSAHDFEAIYWPNATFEDPLMQAHGIARIKSAFYAMPKVFLDSTVLKYSMWEEETLPASGEILIDNLQQYKLLQLGPVGYFVTMQSLIKLTVTNGKVMRHEDLWGGYRLWNRHTVWVPFVGRLAETIRWGNMLVTHVLMGFGKGHKTLDKDDVSLHLKVA